MGVGVLKFKKWEISLMVALAVSVIGGAVFAREQEGLSDKLIRLHVVAASDSPEDQAVKLEVRDHVLEVLGETLDGARGREEAARRVAVSLPEIERAARGAASGAEARVRLGREYFPTREYDTFSLPAGRYLSLRVTLGSGGGRNWWCVVFPPLCDMSGGDFGTALSDDEIALITDDTAGVVVKFKAMELIGRLREWLNI
jgi:stage II sporulation protein R